MGVVGAALGTGLAELITAILMLYFLLYRSKMLGICRGDCEQMTVGVGSSDEQDTAADNQRERVLSESEGLSESRSLSESEGLSENRILSENRGQSENRRDSENKRQSENREQSVYRRGKILSEDNSFRPQADVVRTAFRIGAPMGLQHMLMGGAQVVSTIIVAPLGTVAIAANSLAITVESLCYMPGYGIAEAATTLVGQSIGAGQRLMTRSFAYMSVGLGMLVMTLMGVLMWVFAPELMGIMSPVEEIIAQGTEVLRIEAWAEPMFAAAIVCNGVFIGAADTLIPAVMSLTSMWCVRLSLAALLARDYGLRGVWIAMAIELTFRGLLFLTRLFRGKWAMEKVPTGKR
ncbi:MAG: hypothetical protein K6C10_12470 [Prevotella sp.]|nr:hypothetical protein [Prevotella sp.]